MPEFVRGAFKTNTFQELADPLRYTCRVYWSAIVTGEHIAGFYPLIVIFQAKAVLPRAVCF